jgi:RNA polymerase sigma-70 factor (ECF subfamily)
MLGRIYGEHRQGLYTLALSIARNPDLAEDAVHDAFERLCRSEAPAGDLVSYVFAAVRNAALDQLRRKTRPGEKAVSIFDAPPAPAVRDGQRPDHSAMETERDRLLRQALDSLPDEQREVIVMKLYSDLTFEQIAQTLGEPLSTVSSRYRRSLDRLRSCVESFV